MPKPGVPGRKLARPKIEVRGEQEWIDRIKRAAQDLGLPGGASEYVRDAINRALEADERGEAPGRKVALLAKQSNRNGEA